jgi:dCMP deaminase
VHAEQNAIINAARAGVSLLGGDIYIFGKNRETGKILDAFPCFICKKMIINAGLNRVITSTQGKQQLKIFNTADWVNEWREQDIIEDKYQYGKSNS